MEIVLVVEDDIETCKLLVRLLNKSGYIGECAFNGSQAIAYLQNNVPSLAILDYMMPDMTGIEVLRWIRKNTPTSAMPVVMLSAITDAQIQKNARDIGANDYWVKAKFDYSTLPTAIASVLGNPPLPN